MMGKSQQKGRGAFWPKSLRLGERIRNRCRMPQDRQALSDVLVTYWSARERFLDAGLSTNRSDPIGGLGESLAASAFWPTESVPSAFARARAVRLGTDDTGLFGPALGSMPMTWNGRRNSLAVDLAVPWECLIEKVPNLADFGRNRQADRLEWDVTLKAAPEVDQAIPPIDRYAGLARIQVKARYAPDAPNHDAYDAVPFEVVRDGAVPAIDLILLIMFAQRDEEYRDLKTSNFVWTAVLMTNECLRQLDIGKKSAKLDWWTVHGWWGAGNSLPAGAHDVTGLLREVRVSGW
jgi:hypothetical protein